MDEGADARAVKAGMTIYRERRDGEKCRDGPFLVRLDKYSRYLNNTLRLTYLLTYWSHKNGSPIKICRIEQGKLSDSLQICQQGISENVLGKKKKKKIVLCRHLCVTGP